MRLLALAALLLTGCTPPAGSYSMFVIHNDDIKTLSTSGELSEPVISGSNINLMLRLDPQTAVGSTMGEDGFSLDTFLLHADGTTTAGPNIPWLSSVPLWAEEARRMFFFDGPTFTEVDFEAGTVTQPPLLNDSATLLAVNADATRSLWNIRVENNNQLHIIDGPYSTDPILTSLSEGAMRPQALAFNPDSTRIYNVGANEVNQPAFGWTDLDSLEFTEIEGWGVVDLVERQGDQMLAIPQGNLAFYTMDPDPPNSDEPIFSGAWPVSGAGSTMGFSPDLAWVLWGTEMFDSAPGTFRYELRPLPDNSGGTESANYVDIIRDVDWNLRGAVILD